MKFENSNIAGLKRLHLIFTRKVRNIEIPQMHQGKFDQLIKSANSSHERIPWALWSE
jgi:hypothetical protein